MNVLNTLSGKSFKYNCTSDGELVVYPSDKNDQHQNKFALAITPYTINFVKDAIKQKGQIYMGASRDNPPENSLGALLKKEGQTPQQLSYLIPILIEQGFCNSVKEGKAFLVRSKGD